MIDYYDILETAVQTFIRTELASYFPEWEQTVTKSDDTYLDQGHDYFCMIYPGVFPTEIFAGKIISVNWEVILDVFARFNTSEEQAWIDLKKIRAELFWLFNVTNKGRTINGAHFVRNAFLSAEDRPRYIPVEEGNPDSGMAFIGQVMLLTVNQKIDRTE